MERLINFYTEIDALARRAMPKGQRRRRTGGRADEYSTPSNGGGHAPELGGVPGAAVHAAMGARRALTGVQTDDRYIMTALGDDREYSALLAEVRRQGNADIEARAAAVLEHDRQRVAEAATKRGGRDVAPGTRAAKKLADPVLKRIRTAARHVLRVGALVVRFEPGDGRPCTKWLSDDVSGDTLRGIDANDRILKGLRRWTIPADELPAIVVYERAAGRIAAERPGCGGAPPASFVRGLLHSVCMPTAKANPGDHYVVLENGGMGESVGGGVTARFASVEEGLRAFGAPLDSPLRAAMIGGPLNPLRAMQALGNAVHIPTMRGILRALPEGSLPAGVEYAGAYVGPDTIAAAVQAEQPDMRYVFGSEKDTHTREACLKAWGGHGLVRERLHMDATSDAATREARVGAWSLTATCCAHSTSNRERTEGDELSSLDDIDRSLDYVRHAGPGVVLIENVCTGWVVLGISDMLGHIDGYVWKTGSFDPWEDQEEPMARRRQFWVGVRVCAPEPAGGE